jgi:hypothetical protein
MVGLARWARFVLGPVIVRARGEFLTPLAERGAQDGDREPGRDRASIALHQVSTLAVRLSTADRGRQPRWPRHGGQPGSVEVAHPDSTVVVHPHQDLQREVERDQRGHHHGRRAAHRVPEHQQLGVTQCHPGPPRLAAVVHHQEELGAGGSDRRSEPLDGLGERQRSPLVDDTAGRPDPAGPLPARHPTLYLHHQHDALSHASGTRGSPVYGHHPMLGTKQRPKMRNANGSVYDEGARANQGKHQVPPT